MTRWTAVIVALGLVITAAACASTGTPRTPPSGTVITQQEIAGSLAPDAFELIRNLRPRWLHDRGPETFGRGGQATIVVYLDGTRMGGVDSLRQISVRDLARAERLDTTEATRRWGMGHPRGAIALTTK